MTLIELEAALKEACLDSYGEGCYDIGELPEEMYNNLTVVEDGDWTQDYKYQNQDTIVQDNEGNYFMISNSRSGSYHTDWEYHKPFVGQVEKIVKVVETTTWKAV